MESDETDQWQINQDLVTQTNGSILSKVADLINPSITNWWDSQLVKDTFYEEDANLILAIPLRENHHDFIAWHAD